LTRALHLELARIVLASGAAELREIVPSAEKLLKRLDDWKMWRMAGKPFQIRDGGLKDQIEDEFDEIYTLEAEFQKVAKAQGHPELI
jgi:hypothetical protein